MSSTIEKISERALQTVEQELERLLGVQASLMLRSGGLVRNDDFIELLDDGFVVVRLEFDGATEGKGALAATRKTAIRMAGKLLMLPIAELNTSIGNDEYDDEYRYAYAEIVKCLVGTFVQSLQQSTYQCAEIRCRKQEILTGDDLDSIRNDLQYDQTYYLATVALTLAGVIQGDILLLLPAFMVVCGQDLESVERVETENIADSGDNVPRRMISAITPWADSGTVSASTQLDTLMNLWIGEVNRDLTASFGIQVDLAGKLKQEVNEQQILSKASGKKLLFTSYQVDGPVSGTVAIVGCVEDAMGIGSLLGGILHGSTLNVDTDQPFDSDFEDGFHELCSIILAIGAEWLTDKTGETFTVTRDRSSLIEYDTVNPREHLFLEEPHYSMISLAIARDGDHLGYMSVLSPSLLVEQLELVLQDFETDSMQNRISTEPERSVVSPYQNGSRNQKQGSAGGKILLVSASDNDAEPIRKVFENEQLEYDQISITSETLQDSLVQEYRTVFLVVAKPDEMALSDVIKINSIGVHPLVVAAPQWTQSQVVKALRYGAADIMLTPVSGRELHEKLKGLKPVIHS